LSTMGSMTKPTFPLTLFEKLKNVSESDDVIFGGDGIGRFVHLLILHRFISFQFVV
jgi:hypothetical protein